MEAVIVLCLAAHLLCVNIAAAGPLVCLWCEWKEAKGNRIAGEAGRWLAWQSFWLLLIGTAIGVLMGVLLWSDDYRSSIVSLGPKIFWGSLEWLFSVVLSGLYAFWWWKAGSSGKRRLLRSSLALLSGTNLLYHFPFLFTVLAGLEAQPLTEEITSAQFRELIVTGPVLSRSVHFILACFAVCGAAWLYHAAKRAGKGELEEAEQIGKWGGRLAMVPTLMQLVVGLWVVTQISSFEQKALMGRDPGATAAFVMSLLLSFWLMHLTAAAAFGKGNPRKWMMTVAVMISVVLLMSYVERATRRIAAANSVADTVVRSDL